MTQKYVYARKCSGLRRVSKIRSARAAPTKRRKKPPHDRTRNRSAAKRAASKNHSVPKTRARMCFAAWTSSSPKAASPSSSARAVAAKARFCDRSRASETIDEGSIHLAGRDVTKLPPRDRDVAMVFQSYALYPHLTVRKKSRVRSRASQNAARGNRNARARSLRDARARSAPRSFAEGGSPADSVSASRWAARSRVAHVMFLFDEPLSNLDAALRAEVRVDIPQAPRQARRDDRIRHARSS